jgi:hypothetical protein
MASTKIEYAKGGSDFRTKGTISCWVKRSSLGVQQSVWSWGENNSSDAYLRFDTADNIEMHCDGAGGTFNTTSLHRDINGWYHIVFSIDGSNATANLRRRFWINGVQIDEGSGKNDISTFSTSVLGWHSSQDLWIGARARSQQSGDLEYFDGIMSHFHFCSNYSYSASDFGSFDSTTGEWSINTSPNVQYGTHGFFLKMENSSNMDFDSSSNGHVLTTSGTLTKTEDCPDNVFATFNTLAQTLSGITYSNGNTVASMTSDVGQRQSISTLGMPSGKFYMECKLQAIGSTGGSFPYVGIVAQEKYDADMYVGGNGTGWHPTGDIYNGGSNSSSGSTYTTGDIIGVAVDIDNSKLYWHKNGTYILSGNPSTGANGYDISARTAEGVLGFGVSHWNNNGIWHANFGNGYFGTTAVSSAGTNASGIGIFEYDVPAGFTALSTKGLNE